MIKLGKLHIHSSFFLFSILVIAMGQIKQFFLIVAATTIHELSHIAAAKLKRLKINGILITPIGETAYIEGFDSLPAISKNIVLLAGPLANIIPSAIIFSFFRHWAEAEQFMYISFAIGVFNLLPIYPLDGGKLLFIFLGNRLGIIKSIKYIKFITKAGVGALFFLGFIQLVLFPLNFSLLAIGAFLLSVFEREKSSMVFSYYRCMMYKSERLRNGIKAKTAAVGSESAVADVEPIFTWDYFHIIHVISGGNIAATLTEKQIFEAGIKTAAKVKLLDIIENNGII